MPEPPPQDREHLAELEQRLELIEETAEALSLLPQRVVDLRDVVEDLRAAIRGVRRDMGRSDERLDALERVCAHIDGGVDALVVRRTGDDGEEVEVRPRPSTIDLKLWLTIVSSIAVPIVVAIIATKG